MIGQYQSYSGAACVLLLAAGAVSQSPTPPARVAGTWVGVESAKTVVQFEKERVVVLDGGRTVRHLARYGSDFVEINRSGMIVRLPVKLDAEGSELVFAATGKVQERFVRSKSRKPLADPVPRRLPKPARVARARRNRIAADLRARIQRDRAAREKDDARLARIVDGESRRWLDRVVGEVGWLDARRFGAEVAGDAVELLLHAGELDLMLAVLPLVRTDAEKRRLRDPRRYAELADRIRLMLGRRQVYGTQIVNDAEGRFVVFPLEDPKTVDRRRKKIRLPSLAEDLETQKKWTGSAVEVQVF